MKEDARNYVSLLDKGLYLEDKALNYLEETLFRKYIVLLILVILFLIIIFLCYIENN
jgi:t-SNARE complex subunit (syntaxin)